MYTTCNSIAGICDRFYSIFFHVRAAYLLLHRNVISEISQNKCSRATGSNGAIGNTRIPKLAKRNKVLLSCARYYPKKIIPLKHALHIYIHFCLRGFECLAEKRLSHRF